GTLLGFVLYLLFAFCFNDIFKRKLALLLAAFGGGIGVWVYPLLEPFYRGLEIATHMPIDLTMGEPFIFNSTYYSSHYIASLTLFVLIILFTLLAIQNKRLLYGLYAGLCGLVLANFHPFTYAIIAFVFVAYQIFLLIKEKKSGIWFLKYLLVFGFVSSPSIFYHLYMLATPWWQNQMWNSMTEAPDVIFIVFGFGLLLLFSVLTVYKSLRKEVNIKFESFLMIWLLAQMSLIFLPTSIQRRFLEGYQIILVILSVCSLDYFLKKRSWLLKGRIFPATIFFLCFSLSLFLVVIFDFYNFYHRIGTMYIFSEHYVAMKELKKITGPDEIIIADLVSANMIPGLALRRVFVGHGVETINAEKKIRELTIFAKTNNDQVRKEIIKRYNIKYLFYDPGWNWGFDPNEKEYLEQVYEKGGYKVYKVKI
ncbi:MAG: hypothetical protein KKD35_01715, partial [Elusimicrobia bacterium]|nr:hypothetical protein [Elusimicrobiota bacterium]